MGSISPTPKLTLLPLDPSSPSHLSRLTAQRIACGWRSDEVPDWAEQSKQGTINLYWLVIHFPISPLAIPKLTTSQIPSPSLPNHNAILTSHHTSYPSESVPLTDTSTSIFSRPRSPSGEEFHPIGHIALSFPPLSELASVSKALTEKKTGYISKLYISWATQSAGFGSAAVRELERLARDELGTEVMYLDTMDEKVQMRQDTMDALYGARGLPYPKVRCNASFLAEGVCRKGHGA